MPDEENSKGKFRLGKSERRSRQVAKLKYNPQDAVSRVLPHATQVADRYHLVQNLRDHLQQFLDRRRICLSEDEDLPLKGTSTNTQGLSGSLADETGTLDCHAEAPGCQPVSTSQPMALVG